MDYQPLDIEEFTRSLIQQAAESRPAKKPLKTGYVEPILPQHDISTANILTNILNGRK